MSLYLWKQQNIHELQEEDLVPCQNEDEIQEKEEKLEP